MRGRVDPMAPPASRLTTLRTGSRDRAVVD